MTAVQERSKLIPVRFAVWLAAGAVLGLLTVDVAQAQGGRWARTGTLVVEGDYPGAEVFVDAEPVGTLPLDPLELPPGNHTLRVTQPGFTEHTDVFRIQPRQETRVTVELMAVSMALTVESDPPGAQVFVDGNFAGEAPVEVDLLEGQHSIRVRHAGFHETIRTIEAEAGRDMTLELNLEPLPEEQRQVLAEPGELAWYEEPLTWVLVGAGALAVAAGIVLVVTLSAEDPSQLDQFCEMGMEGCVLVEPGF